MKAVNLKEKYDLFHDYWNPRIVAELNGQHVKVVKVKGELIWHRHEHEDELFYVIKGKLKICFENSEKTINEGELFVVPKGITHKPIAQEECWLVLFEPSGTKHTGDQKCEQTVSKFEWI
ncbi:cupin domain-containing protein [Kordia sp. YSTF-M3]|uniref:Cupin domain-containing protein n=1 Tax=Kordia aestuariivivens TaxID=2759037 RepID=A0ABR7QCA2_9FLAO|nr:cupin domain-containing protein [Kordia aestuariivivens]MBC8756207.1 cupin domain-containing protein [Kordia aestuariivivens]